MKKSLFQLAAVGLLVGLLSLPLVAQEEGVQTPPFKALRIGLGVGISEINYLVGVGEFPIGEEFSLWLSLGFAGYPRGEFPGIGMVLAFPASLTFFTNKITLFGQPLSWGMGGLGLTIFYFKSPELPGITVSFARFSILLLQAKWEGKLDKYSLFLKGGPFLTLGPGLIGLLLEGGIWF